MGLGAVVSFESFLQRYYSTFLCGMVQGCMNIKSHHSPVVGATGLLVQGESVAMVLHMVGARPVKESTGRVARYELIPLQELGRPRIDVLCNMSGIFRDSFQVGELTLLAASS
jgi:hypothetical protein